MPSLYGILGVEKTASVGDIKTAFKRMASKCHPDKNPDDMEATEKFQVIQRAYAVVKDPIKRKRYDETGAENSEPSLEEEASRLIASIYLQIAERAKFQARNYLVDTIKALQNSLRQCLCDLKLIRDQYSGLHYLIENTAADEIVLVHLNGKLAEFAHKKSHAEQATNVMNKALEMLDEYKYTGTIPRASQAIRPWTTEPYVGA